MSVHLAQARLTAAQAADTPEERVGHLTAALANVKEALKSAAAAIADADPRQEEMNLESIPVETEAEYIARQYALARRRDRQDESDKMLGTVVAAGLAVEVTRDGVVQTPADTEKAPRPHRDPVNETIILNFLREHTDRQSWGNEGALLFGTVLEDRGGVLAVKTKTIAAHTGLDDSTVSRILSRLGTEGLHVAQPKKGWWRAAVETEHTFAYGDAENFAIEKPDDTQEYDEAGAVTPETEAAAEPESAPAQPLLEEQRNAPLASTTTSDDSAPDTESSTTPATSPSAGTESRVPPEQLQAMRDYIDGRRDEGASDAEIAEEIRALDRPEPVAVLSATGESDG